MNEDDIIEEEGDVSSDEVQAKIRSLKDKLKDCEEEKTTNLSGWQRERADFVNYKRDAFTQIQNARDQGKASVIESLMPALESFELALAHNPDDTGLKQVYSQVWQGLKREGLEQFGELDVIFDASKHEAVGEVIVADRNDEGIVKEIIRKGYVLNSRVVSPAKVKVGVLES